MALHSFERETTFGWSDDTKVCECITFNRSLDRKLLDYCKKFPDQFKMVREHKYDDIIEGHEFTFPKNLITIRQPKKREMSEEQRKAAGERMRKAQTARKKKVDKD